MRVVTRPMAERIAGRTDEYKVSDFSLSSQPVSTALCNIKLKSVFCPSLKQICLKTMKVIVNHPRTVLAGLFFR